MNLIDLRDVEGVPLVRRFLAVADQG